MQPKRSEFEELLSVVGECLESAVLPHVNDHYAQLQLRAAREALRHIGARFSLVRCRDESEINAVRIAIDHVIALGFVHLSDGVQPMGIGDEQSRLHAQLAQLIDQIYAHPDEGLRERALGPIWRAVREQFDAEARRTRTAKSVKAAAQRDE